MRMGKRGAGEFASCRNQQEEREQCCREQRSRGANGLRPEGARELSPGFTLGKLSLSKIAL
jgi:hypothetical protein